MSSGHGDPLALQSAIFDRFFGDGVAARPMAEMCHNLTVENKRLRDEMKKREEDAYEHGLGDAAAVYRENRMLVQVIAALTDRQHALLVRP